MARRLMNVIIVFLVSGLWHGADWRYLMWGLACGVLCAFGRLTIGVRKVVWKYNPLYRATWCRNLIQRMFVFILFVATLVFFASALYNADPYGVYAGIFQGWQGGPGAAWSSVQTLLHDSGIDGRLPVVLTCASLIVFAAESHGRNVARWIRAQNFTLRWTLYYAAAAALLFFGAFGQSAFIYQQF